MSAELEWKPIKTAPKTLGPHLVWHSCWDHPDLCYNLGRGKWRHTYGQQVGIAPTYWMPLPKPPVGEPA